eukprot:950262-Pelagomonas_calceolata.AAC.1
MAGSWCHPCKGVGRGGVEANTQQANPNFQDSDIVQCGRYAWTSAAQFLPHNSAATHLFIVLSTQTAGEFQDEQI